MIIIRNWLCNGWEKPEPLPPSARCHERMSRVGNRIGRALIAGLGATIVLSICIYIKRWTGIVPQFNPIQALVRVSTLRLGAPLLPWVGWAEHFFIGTILWGIAFAILVPLLKGPRWLRGIEFAVGAWILMMVLLMPPAGDGWLAAYLGYGAPLAALVLHIIYAFSLGGFYAPPAGIITALDPPPPGNPSASLR